MCVWHSIPLGGAHSQQVRVPDDAPLQSPRVHDAGPEQGNARGYWHGVWPKRSPGEEPSHQVRVPDDALLTRPRVRVQVAGERMRDGSSVWGIINFAFNSHFTEENAVSR